MRIGTERERRFDCVFAGRRRRELWTRERPSGRSVRDTNWGIGPDVVAVDECIPEKSDERQLEGKL